MATAATEGAVGSIPVTFFTTTCEHQMPTQTYTVPLNTLSEGLQQLVDSVLEVEPKIPFDFLINDEFIGTSIERFLRRRSMNFEEVLHIEYTPAMQAQEGSKAPHDDWVSCVRAPQCGNPSILLTAAYDHCVRLWVSEECVAIGSKHTEAVKEISLNPVAPSADAQQTTRKPTDSKKRRATDAIPAVQFASGGKDGRLCLWSYHSGANRIECIGSAQPHVGSIDTVDVSPNDGRLVASGSWDTTIKVFTWETIQDDSVAPEKKAPLVSFSDHARSVLSCRFAQDGRTLYSTGLDGTIKSWDVEALQLGGTITGDHAIQKLSVKPNGASGDLIIAGCTDNRVRLFDSRQKAAVKSFSGHRQWVYGAAWLWHAQEANAGPSGGTGQGLFASCSEDATVRVWDLRSTSSALLTLDALHTDGVLDVTYVGNQELASGGKDNRTKTISIQK